jgi:hypothetical protein
VFGGPEEGSVIREAIGIALLSTPASLSGRILAVGWEQIDTESYHGPEGWYHDAASGALVRYWTGPSTPDYSAVPPTTGVACSVTRSTGTPRTPCILETKGPDLQVFIGPDAGGVYAVYWAKVANPHQDRRVRDLALSNPLAVQLYSGRSVPHRDPLESDLKLVKLGASLDTVRELVGNPMTVVSRPDGGFVAEFVIWGRWPGPKGKPTWASRVVKLTFSKDRILVEGRRTRG